MSSKKAIFIFTIAMLFNLFPKSWCGEEENLTDNPPPPPRRENNHKWDINHGHRNEHFADRNPLRNKEDIETEQFSKRRRSNKFGRRFNKFRRCNNSGTFLRNFPRLKQFLDSLSEEEKERLKKLRNDDPQAFRKFIKSKLKEYKYKKLKQNKQISMLVKKYRKASSEEEKKKIKEQLHSLLRTQFNEILKNQEKSLKRIETRLQQLKEKYEKRKKYKEEIINRRLDKLLRDPDLDW